MSGSLMRVLAASTILGAAACTDLVSGSGESLVLDEAFQTVPVGFSANSQSFDASADPGEPFRPGPLEPAAAYHGGDRSAGGGKNAGGGTAAGHKDHDRRDGFGRSLRGLLMGGGLGPDFIGAIGFGRGKGRGPFGAFKLPDRCTFDAASGRVTCPETTRHGLTVNVSYAFKDTAGNAQPKFDTVTTNSVNVRTSVQGTKTRKDGRVTSTVSHASDRTIAGLAKGSNRRTVNGTSSAQETVNGTRDSVKFTAVRVAGDTTNNVVIPIVDGKPTIPSSGTIIRSMTATITPEGGTAKTRSRREVVAFDGTNVIKVTITQNGVTKNCTVTLPAKKLVCD